MLPNVFICYQSIAVPCKATLLSICAKMWQANVMIDSQMMVVIQFPRNSFILNGEILTQEGYYKGSALK